jgi:hypothetical protein
MSKSKNRKWYEKIDHDYDDDHDNSKKDRRKAKRIKNALKSNDVWELSQMEADGE